MIDTKTRLGAIALATLLLAAACGGSGTSSAPSGAASASISASTGTQPSAAQSEEATTDATDAATEPASVEPSVEVSEPASDAPSDGTSEAGSIFVSGSSTVEPISLAVAEDYAAQNPDFGYTVEGPGTGDGFALFCDGETDISDASREIKEEEAQICTDNGIEYVELKVAIDGLSVVTSPDTAIECLTFADLYALLGPESQGITNWNDAEALAQELGSTTDLPDAPLSITAPGPESGTYDSFIEIALGDIAEARLEAGNITEDVAESLRPDYVASPNDNVIVEGVGGTPNSLGFVGFAFFEENQESLKAVAVDGGEGCVEPTPETIADGSYPIARSLFIYPNLAKVEENPAVAGYVDFYLSDEGIQNVAEVGYVALTPEDLEATRGAWDGR